MRLTRYNADTIHVDDIAEWDKTLIDSPKDVAWLDAVAPDQSLVDRMVQDMGWHPFIKEYHSLAGQRPSFYALDGHLRPLLFGGREPGRSHGRSAGGH